jgi:hypothetical protein
MITFVTNCEGTAIGQATQQLLRGAVWRGVYRRHGGLFEVHDSPPVAGEPVCWMSSPIDRADLAV